MMKKNRLAITKTFEERQLFLSSFELHTFTKKRLITHIIKLQKFIMKIQYQMYKSKLPRLRTIKQKALPKRKTKRKFSRKQLAAQKLFAKRARAGTLRKFGGKREYKRYKAERRYNIERGLGYV